jgi:pimeloyl-ACP methyl ester carboxylesterase
MRWIACIFMFFLYANSLLADDSFYDITPPGKRIDIGGYKLHINCQGIGSPTIILDAGLGDWSVHWQEVQEKLKADNRVCSYDRAGYGWSDPGPRPRSSAQIVTELHSLLEKAGEKPPYLLAGHSFGGINMRLFASTYPAEIAGLVLIDASHPESLPYRRDDSGRAPSSTPTHARMLMQPLEADISLIPATAIAAVKNSLLHTKSISAGTPVGGRQHTPHGR